MGSNWEEESYSFAMQLIYGSTLAAALKSATELDLFELIKKAGPGTFVSPVELAAQIPTTNPEAPAMLDRILRLLAANNILECSLRQLPHGSVERLYSLPPHSNFLTRNDAGLSLASILFMFQDKVFMETWNQLKNAVLEGGVPFDRAFGMNGFEFTAKDPRFNKLFNQAMYDQSAIFMKKIVEIYKGFDGLKSLVDVGGGTGASLKMIISKYPSIKGINFDLPQVIQDAPSHPGVEHVSGDMFDSVPRGDAIFIRCVCHDWGDAECLKILRNCYEALSDNGKVIIAESIISEIPSKDSLPSTSFFTDVIMMLFNPDAKERTEKEFQTLANASGFKEFRKVCCAFGVWIMELYK